MKEVLKDMIKDPIGIYFILMGLLLMIMNIVFICAIIASLLR
jgi:hypothetical protein